MNLNDPKFEALEGAIVRALDAADKKFVSMMPGVTLHPLYDAKGCTISENLDYITLNQTNGDWYGMKHKAKEQKR